MFEECWKPIPEFNTWVGVFGTPEFRAQDRQARALCSELKLTIKDPPWLRHLEADRLYQCIQSRQRATTRPYQFQPAAVNEFFWDKTKLADRIHQLLEEELIENVKENTFQLKR